MYLIASISRKLFRSSIPSYIFILTILVLLGGLFLIGKNPLAPDRMNLPADPVSTSPTFNFVRLKGYELINPVLITEPGAEASQLSAIKTEITAAIQQQTGTGMVSKISVYLRNLNDFSYVSINSGEQFNPGSLMKLPILISYLKETELVPGLLTKPVYFANHFQSDHTPNFKGAQLIPGSTYTVSQLLQYMIIESNNDAATLLMNSIDFKRIQKVFDDLHIAVPNNVSQSYTINVSDYSKFMRILYNGSYINHELSQYALSLLVQAKFDSGITRTLSPDIKVAHKFGESGHDNVKELHEAAIVYMDENPYLLVVMSRGPELSRMADAISNLSDIIFKNFKSMRS